MSFRSGMAGIVTRLKKIFMTNPGPGGGVVPDYAALAQELLNCFGLGMGLTQTRVTVGTTLTEADNGKMIVSAGAGALTHVLPEPAEGLVFSFVNIVDQNMTVNGATGNKIIGLNNLVSDGIAYQTAGNKIGAHCRFIAIDTDGAGTYKWLFIPYGPHTVTISA